jgi:hypothetical protein
MSLDLTSVNREWKNPMMQQHISEIVIPQLFNMRECYGVKCHFQQYFSYIMAVSFIGGEELEYPERTTDLPQVTD